MKLFRSEGTNRCIIRWLPWERELPVVTVVLAKHKDLGNRNWLNPEIFKGMKEPEHQEKYISLPTKTEEMV